MIKDQLRLDEDEGTDTMNILRGAYNVPQPFARGQPFASGHSPDFVRPQIYSRGEGHRSPGSVRRGPDLGGNTGCANRRRADRSPECVTPPGWADGGCNRPGIDNQQTRDWGATRTSRLQRCRAGFVPAVGRLGLFPGVACVLATPCPGKV